MRIGIDCRALMEGKITGVQVYITNLLEALFEIDKENEYLLFVNAINPPSLPPIIRGGVGRGQVTYKIFHYPNKLFIPAQKFFGFPKVDKLLGGIDLFFSPHWRATALSPKIPLVATFHDLSFEVVPEFFTVRQRLWHAFMDYREAAARAAKIIAVSESTKKDLKEIYKIPENKIEVIYPGVHSHPHLASRPPSPLGRGAGGEDYFLYFGTFEPRKNIESVIAAYEIYYQKSRVKRKLVLAGSSGWKTRIVLPEGLSHTINIFQDVSEEQKSKLFADSFAFLFLSYYEGFGFPVLEAASHGVPVISSLATSLLEIGEDFALFVNPFRPGQTAQAMLELERDPVYYEQLRQKGLEATKKFKWHETAQRTLELFNNIK
ncbi:MAG: glycosyltransferase family 1 protein [bacterium]|nr:glycosyltransferase family 1 protein [bacterium]